MRGDPRFSKATVTETIRRHIEVVADGHRFDMRHGWDQVRRCATVRAQRNGEPVDYPAAMRAYGAVEALCALAEELGLDVGDGGVTA